MAMVGDNPMQSEFACHIGMNGKFFCRVCEVSGLVAEERPNTPVGSAHNSPDQNVGSANDINGGEMMDSDAESIMSEHESISDEEHSVAHAANEPTRVTTPPKVTSAPKKGRRSGRKKKTPETMQEMVECVTNFMKLGSLRSRTKSVAELQEQYNVGSQLGGITACTKRRTASGIKDRFQFYFMDKIHAITTPKYKKPRQQKLKELDALIKTFPPDITSPVWRIHDFDPHQDTPVEILHVVLLGFVKYFWRDAVARCKNDKATLIARLASLDTSGLGIPPVAAETLVHYAKSLTGRDFRVIAQVAPFILHGLMPRENMEVWIALSRLVPLVWQPEIADIGKHLADVDSAITQFLECVCTLTPDWFNKPKFHILLHLPTHIQRFGPPILFATEGFESYNAIIRCCSIHSNRHAPSKDIAVAMAKGNRVRHLLSGGHFQVTDENDRHHWASRGDVPFSLLMIN
ncbi:hypothetical protein AAF712_003284 [Marasmius tenuissimus]|uniref:Transposase n=1 Tax=Marasmius tenuissimus TaxID=585030 RepID=A0ABR3A6U6_9AGAR